MRKLYERFTLLVVLLLLSLCGAIESRHLLAPKGSAHAPLLLVAFDAETIFSLGLRLPLACADISDLELIPRVSHKVISRVYAQRSEILRYALNQPPEVALTSVFGVGDTIALHLLEYISLTGSCAQERSSRTPFTPTSTR